MPNENADYLLRKLQAKEPGAARTVRTANKLTRGALPALYGAYKATTDTIGFASAPQKQYSTLYGTYNNLLQSFWHEKYEQRQKEAENLMANLEKYHPKETRQGEVIGTIGQGIQLTSLAGAAGLTGVGKALGVGALATGQAAAEGSENPLGEGAEWAASELIGSKIISPVLSAGGELIKGAGRVGGYLAKKALPKASTVAAKQVNDWATYLNSSVMKGPDNRRKANLLKDAEHQVKTGRSQMHLPERTEATRTAMDNAGAKMSDVESAIHDVEFSTADMEKIAQNIEREMGSLYGKPKGRRMANTFRRDKGLPIKDSSKSSMTVEDVLSWNEAGDPVRVSTSLRSVTKGNKISSQKDVVKTENGKFELLNQTKTKTVDRGPPPELPTYKGSEVIEQLRASTEKKPISRQAYKFRQSYNPEIRGKMSPEDAARHKLASDQHANEARQLRMYKREPKNTSSILGKAALVGGSGLAGGALGGIPGGIAAVGASMTAAREVVKRAPVYKQRIYGNIIDLHSKYPGIFGSAGDALDSVIAEAGKSGGVPEAVLKALARIEKEYNSKTGYQSRQNKNQ